MHQDDTDDPGSFALATSDDEDEFASNGVQHLLTRRLLRDCVPKQVLRRLDDGCPVCLVIEVPGPEWCTRIAASIEEFWPHSVRIVRDGSSKSEKPTNGNDVVAAALIQGRAVVGVSHAPGALLPSALVSSADARVIVKSPTPKQIKFLLRSCASGPVPQRIGPDVSQGLTFDEIAIAFRKGASARHVLRNLSRCRDAKTRPAGAKEVPPLEELPGFSEAKKWGLSLKSKLSEFRLGNKKWEEFSSAAVLVGPPGTGKTIFAQALARSCNLPIICTSVGQWFMPDGHLDSVIKSLQAAWDSAKALAPSILFIDELDALPDRNRLSDRNRDYWTPLVTHCLSLFDGAITSRNDGIILLGATNHPGHLDQALIRPGRFDRLIEVPVPGPDELSKIISFHLRGQIDSSTLLVVAQMFPLATPADAAQWARDAREAAERQSRKVTLEDIIGVAAPPEVRTEDQIRRVAIHESAHAIVAHAYGRRLDHLSIVPQGNSGGRTLISRLVSRCPTLDELESAVLILLAGRAAEETILGVASAGAEADLAEATELVCALHASQGLGNYLVHLAASGRAKSLLLHHPKLLGIVNAHIGRLYERAKEVVDDKRAEIQLIALALASARVLRADQIEDLLANTHGGRVHAGRVRTIT